MSEYELACAVRNLLDDTRLVLRAIARRERERREERRAPLRQTAMRLYERDRERRRPA